MSNKAKVIVVLIALSGCGWAQRNQVNFCVAAGTNYFLNQKSANNNPGFSKMVGINFIPYKRNSVFLFKPELNLIANDYDSNLQQAGSYINVKQRLIGLNLDVLFKVSKNNYLKAGLFINKVMSSWLNVVFSQNQSGYYSYGNSYLNNTYTDNYIQAGISTGACFPFQIKTAELKFNVTVFQNATPFLQQDLEIAQLPAKDGKVIFSNKALATYLLLGLEISMRKHLKKKTTEEEE